MAGKPTTMKISPSHRDALSAIAAALGGVTLDDALADVLFVYDSMKAVERLTMEQVADWRTEAHRWAEADFEVAAR